MHNMKQKSVLGTFTAIVVCGAMAAPAHAWSWPWQKPETTAQQTGGGSSSNAVPAAQPSSAAPAPSKPAAAMTTNPKKAGSSKMLGTVESVDAANHRLSLKTSAGKSETFTLSGSSSISDEHDRKLMLSALKAGERVVLHYRSGSNEATRVHVLGNKKA